MDNRGGLKPLNDVADEIVLGHITDKGLDRPPRRLFPRGNPLLKSIDRNKAIDAALRIPGPAAKIVHDAHVMALLRQIQGLWPPQIAVAANDKNFHRPSPLRSINSSNA